jgi:hypothetical protein
VRRFIVDESALMDLFRYYLSEFLVIICKLYIFTSAKCIFGTG